MLKKSYLYALEEVITIQELNKWMEELNDEDVNYAINEIERYFKLEMNIQNRFPQELNR